MVVVERWRASTSQVQRTEAQQGRRVRPSRQSRSHDGDWTGICFCCFIQIVFCTNLCQVTETDRPDQSRYAKRCPQSKPEHLANAFHHHDKMYIACQVCSLSLTRLGVAETNIVVSQCGGNGSVWTTIPEACVLSQASEAPGAPSRG